MKIKIFEDRFSQSKTDGFTFEPHSPFALIRKSLEFGGINQHTNNAIARINIRKCRNIEILVEFKMINDNNNSDNWFGIKLRSTSPLLTDGYLIYIRSNGNVAVYTAGSDLPQAQFKSTGMVLGKKIIFRVRLVGSEFTISVDGNTVTYNDSNNRLLRDGDVYLYSNYTKNIIYDIRVWKIINLSNILKSKTFLSFALLVLLALLIIGLNHYYPQIVNSVVNSPSFRLWSGIK